MNRYAFTSWLGALTLTLSSAAYAQDNQAMATAQPAQAPAADARPLAKNELILTSPVVKSGLELRVTGRKIVIGAGQLLIAGKLVEMPQPTKVVVPPAGFLSVDDDSIKFSSSGKEIKSLVLPHCRSSANDTTILRNILVPDSLKLKIAPGYDGKPLRRDFDYALDEKFGAVTRLPGGTVKPDDRLFADYQCWRRRLDTIAIDPCDNRFVLIQGVPARSAPEPPVVAPNLIPLANVYSDWGDGEIAVADVMPIASAVLPDAKVASHNHKAMAPITKKLLSGDPVKIVFWGDSITLGFDARAREDSFPNAFVRELKKRYPKANLVVSNLGLSQSNTAMRLPALDSDVLALKPDLIVVEFVNDFGLPAHVLQHDYEFFLDAAKKIGARSILCTPHFPSPRMARATDWPDIYEKPLLSILRELAENNDDVALADVARRWQMLDKEGLRADIMLVDGLNHPNTKGHAIYAEELVRCFPSNKDKDHS